MSALGHKRTCAEQLGMSALPPIADIPVSDQYAASISGHLPSFGETSSGHRAVTRFAKPYSNPSIDIFAVVISVGHRISARPFATATFCVPLTE